MNCGKASVAALAVTSAILLGACRHSTPAVSHGQPEGCAGTWTLQKGHVALNTDTKFNPLFGVPNGQALLCDRVEGVAADDLGKTHQ